MPEHKSRHLVIEKLDKAGLAYLVLGIIIPVAKCLHLVGLFSQRSSLSPDWLILCTLTNKYLEDMIMKRKLERLQVGAMPLINSIAERMRLREILYKYIPRHGNEDIPAVETLMLLIFNLTRGKAPLYELNQWVQSIDLRCLGLEEFQSVNFNDDRFGRGLEKAYKADRASLMTDIVISVVKLFDINLDRIHNDSTSVKAFGKIQGKTETGLELKRGNSKDHRPDLKQLVFSLSISSDGGVPIHHKCYSGNRTDDTTHIETWNALRRIVSDPGFVYVADSKLCTDEQLSYIVGNGGRAITIIPETWGEVNSFKEELKQKRKAKGIIWRRQKPGSHNEKEYFSTFRGEYFTTKQGYRIHWIYSSEKRKRDRENREKILRKAEHSLAAINAKINKGRLKTKEAIGKNVEDTLQHHDVTRFFGYEIGKTTETFRVQVGRGRPGKNTKYVIRENALYTLLWARKGKVLKGEANTDGVFPLLCTDKTMSAKETLKAYKYQPNLEKRFCQFKKIHNAAPLLFKKIERVEANMFAFFIALIIQALIERGLRKKIRNERIDGLEVYPEERKTLYPTTNKVLNLFEGTSTYKIIQGSKIVEEFKDELTETQDMILNFLGISHDQYWKSTLRSKK
jgi:transposase